MLQHLSLRHFIIVQRLDLDIRQGFTVLTGETGAGKSILLDALGLLLGDRADAGMVAQGMDKAEISGQFGLNPAIQAWLTEQAFETEDDVLLLRRVIDKEGKSRAFINGSAATLTQLRELSEYLIHIHGQHAHQQLLKTNLQRDLLDEYAQLSNERAAVKQAYQAWHNAKAKLESAKTDSAKMTERLEELTWQLDDINALSPRENEWDELSAQHARLANAAELIQGCGQVAQRLDGDDHDIASMLREQIQTLTNIVGFDERINEYIELLESAVIHVQEAAHGLNNYVQRAADDEHDFASLDERVALWHNLSRKLRVASDELPAHWQALRAEFERLQNGMDLEALEAQCKTAEQQYKTVAKKLTDARTRAAKKLAQLVSESMQTLNMTGGQFAVDIKPATPSSSGDDAVEFMVAAHVGVPLQPLAKVASGGELARISLAIAVITSHANPVQTLIFDEVDSGIGGAVAQVVGQLLRQLGHNRQVLCVTHLPQVAAQGEHHWRVKKLSEKGHTTSHIDVLESDERVDEVARMLGGVELTDTTRAHAREMLAV
jgi:DNA repair protein RecN (Recombination protein N)